MPRCDPPGASLDGGSPALAGFARREVSVPTRAAAGCGHARCERLNGKFGADSSKAGAAPATVIEIRRITQSHCATFQAREGDPPGVALQLESPETGLR